MAAASGGPLPRAVTIGKLHIAFAGCALDAHHKRVLSIALIGATDETQAAKTSAYLQNPSALRASGLRMELNGCGCSVDISAWATKILCHFVNASRVSEGVSLEYSARVGQQVTTWMTKLEPSGMIGGSSRGLLWVGNPVYMPYFGDQQLPSRPSRRL